MGMIMDTSFHGRFDDNGGNPPPPPVRTPDNLRSTDRVEFILGLCEGPIKGLRNGHQDLLINGSPIEDVQGNSSIGDFAFRFLPGASSDETIVPILGGFSNPSPVNQALHFIKPLAGHDPITSPITHRLPAASSSNTPTTAVEVRLAINQLYYQNDAGIFGSSMEFRIDWKLASESSYLLYGNITISGKTTSTYIKDIRIPITATTEAIDIQVTKLSYDGDGATTANDLFWESVQAISNESLSFPNTAVLQFFATGNSKLTSIPEVTSICHGRLVKIPNGYNGLTRTWKGGIWDGTFVIGYTNNPAWVLYDFATNATFGLNTYYPIFLSKWDVFDIANWCDNRINDIPRFSFNLLLAELRGAKELAQYIAGAFNGVFFDDGAGTALLRVDRPSDAVALFSFENVVDGKFEYGFTDITERYNDITVAFVDPQLNYQENRVRVFNQDHIDTFGRIPLDYVAVGCTDADEAARRGRYRLESYLTETLSVRFTTSRQGIYLQPFDIILISDHTMGFGIHGRIQSVSSDRRVINLRDSIYLETGFTYVINIDGPDGIDRHTLIKYQGGNLSTISLVLPVSESIPEQAVFSIECANFGGIPKPFRVIRIEETSPEGNVVSITASEVNRLKWSAIDAGSFSWTPKYTPATAGPSAPTGLILHDVSFTATDGTYHSQLRLDWTRPDAAQIHSFEVEYRLYEDTEWSATLTVLNPNTSITVTTLRDRTDYVFHVRTVNTAGDRSLWAAITGNIANNAPPGKPTSVTAEGINSGIKLTWVNPTDADLRYVEIWEGTTSNRSSPVANLIGSISATSFTRMGLSGGVRRWYWLRAVDFSGNTSDWNSSTGTAATAKAVGEDPYDIASRSISALQLVTDLATPISLIPSIQTSVSTEASSRQNADNALSSRIDTVAATVGNAGALVQTEADARVAGDTANASLITKLSTIVGFNSSSVEVKGTVIDGLKAQYTVKVDVNGNVAGYGLASEAINGTVRSSFVVRADRFAIQNTTSGVDQQNPTIPFIVDSSGVYINSAFIRDATITNAKIKNLTINGTKIQDYTVRNQAGSSGVDPFVTLVTTGNPVLLIGAGYFIVTLGISGHIVSWMWWGADMGYLDLTAGVHTFSRSTFNNPGIGHGGGSATFNLTDIFALELKK